MGIAKKVIMVKHFANIGDLISTLAGLKSYAESKNRTIIFCQQINIAGDYFGQEHPTVDKDNNKVMCNNQMFQMMKPLLLSQKYISDFQVYNGQAVDIDLDIIRAKMFVNIPHQAIQQWPIMAFHELATDLSRAWISIPNKYDNLIDDTISDKVILNFTERYRNNVINYFFLKKHQDKLIFSGTIKEHNLFSQKWGLDIPYLQVDNFLELAVALKKCRFFLGNQSFCWNLCEAQKTPRILEIHQHSPNCQAFIGKYSYGFLHQTSVEYYFDLLMNKK